MLLALRKMVATPFYQKVTFVAPPAVFILIAAHHCFDAAGDRGTDSRR